MKKKICEKLRVLRTDRGYTQQELADRLNMSQNAYSEMETGKTKIDVDKLYMIAEFYKVPIHNIIPELPEYQNRQNGY